MPSNNGIGGVGNGLTALQSESAWQWQPQSAMRDHNPNPPITLDHSGGQAQSIGTVVASGVGTSTAASSFRTGGPYFPVAFNGTSSFIYLIGRPTNAGNSFPGEGSLSLTIEFTGGDNTHMIFFSTSNASMYVGKTSLNKIFFSINETSLAYSFEAYTTNSFTTSSGKLNILISWKTNLATGAKLAQIYVNDVLQSITKTDSWPSFFPDWNSAEWNIGRHAYSFSYYTPCVIDFFWFDDRRIDFSQESNRRLFFYGDNAQVYLGSDGSAPTGSAPKIFLAAPYEQPDSFALNLSGNGDFTPIDMLSADIGVVNPGKPRGAAAAVSTQIKPSAAAATGGSSSSRRRFSSAVFNGTSNSLSLVENPASMPNTNVMTMTSAFKISNTASTTRYFYVNGNGCVFAYIDFTGCLFFGFLSSTLSDTLYVKYDAGHDLRDGQWHSFGVSVFTNFSAGNKVVHLVVDGQYITDFGPTGGITDSSPAFTIGLSSSSHYIGWDGTSNRFVGEMAEFTIDASTSIDFSNSSELVKFFYDDGTPRSMGDDASAAYGFPPALYFRLLSGEPGSAFFFNRTGNTNSFGGTAPAVGNGPLPLGLTYALSNSSGEGVGAATSSGTATGTGATGGSTSAATATAVATSSIVATSIAIVVGAAAAAGTSTPSATGIALKPATAATTATSTATSTGAATTAASVASTSTSTVAAIGNALKPTTGTATGIGNAFGITQPGSNAVASATGTSAATGAATAASTASAAAISAPVATGVAIKPAIAAATGTSTPTATGAATKAAAAAAAGTSTVTVTGVAIKPVTASAIATSTVAANANTVIASTASATATSTAAATYSSGTKRMLLLGVG